jgi:hypothetical protein
MSSVSLDIKEDKEMGESKDANEQEIIDCEQKSPDVQIIVSDENAKYADEEFKEDQETNEIRHVVLPPLRRLRMFFVFPTNKIRARNNNRG